MGWGGGRGSVTVRVEWEQPIFEWGVCGFGGLWFCASGG